MNTIIKRVLLLSSFSVLIFITGCEDEAADNDNTLSTDKFLKRTKIMVHRVNNGSHTKGIDWIVFMRLKR